MRVIRFKPLMLKRILDGQKITTFRKRRLEGFYEVVKGSRFKPVKLGIQVKLVWLAEVTRDEVINEFYKQEGFNSPQEFKEWLKQEKLDLPERGWLHQIETVIVKQ